MELLQKKDNRLGIIISIALHLFLLIAIFFSKGCMELQNPPQFTLEEVITLDFSDAGGGSPGSASPTPPTIEEEVPDEKVITQEESPVAVKSSNSTIKNENATKKAETKKLRNQKTILVVCLEKEMEIVKLEMVRAKEQGLEPGKALILAEELVLEKEDR